MNEKTYWLTGLPCSGKTSICLEMLKHISVTCKVLHLDGDEMRKGLCSDLGFSNEDRLENIRRIAELAKFANANGITVLASFVSPTDNIRSIYKHIIPNVSTIYVECPIKTCKLRDVKGMYRKAYDGLIAGFTGHDAEYEIPEADYTVKGYGDIVKNTHELLRKLSTDRGI